MVCALCNKLVSKVMSEGFEDDPQPCPMSYSPTTVFTFRNLIQRIEDIFSVMTKGLKLLCWIGGMKVFISSTSIGDNGTLSSRYSVSNDL